MPAAGAAGVAAAAGADAANRGTAVADRHPKKSQTLVQFNIRFASPPAYQTTCRTSAPSWSIDAAPA